MVGFLIFFSFSEREFCEKDFSWVISKNRFLDKVRIEILIIS